MSDLQKAFPPIPLRDDVPAICFAVAVLGIVLGGLVVTARMNATEARVAAAPALRAH
jgi:hypothetical protein